MCQGRTFCGLWALGALLVVGGGSELGERDGRWTWETNKARRVNYVTRYRHANKMYMIVYGGADLAMADLSSESVDPWRCFLFFLAPALLTAT